MYKNVLKPVIDFIAALFGLLVLSPIFLTITLCLLVVNRGKPFFIQPRPGKNERIFNIVKFKTMNDRCNANGDLLPDKDRLTRVGAFVRKTSLDELPQLINVLKGDMSLIGPRPLYVDYLPLYSPEQKRRHAVRPGITGWAQVNGRNTISWQKKFKYDVYYVDNLSLALDVKILFLTIYKVVRAKDINAAADLTMEPFNGNN